MEGNKQISVDRLRSVLEEAFKKLGKDKLPTNELKELLGSELSKQEWGGLIVRLTTSKILVKDVCGPLKVGKQRFNYYKLVPQSNEPQKPQESKSLTYIIFNETTKDSERVSGEAELTERVNALLAESNFELSIFKQVSKVKNAPRFESV